jgi:hypothetical protein
LGHPREEKTFTACCPKELMKSYNSIKRRNYHPTHLSSVLELEEVSGLDAPTSGGDQVTF